MFKLRKYHDDRVQSLTYEGEDVNFSVGIIYKGEYDFGSIKKEITTVSYGEISVWTEKTKEWQTYKEGEKFVIEAHTNFKFKCTKVSSYICFYE
jgi:hypothetical protein